MSVSRRCSYCNTRHKQCAYAFQIFLFFFFPRHFQRVQTRHEVTTFLWKLMSNNFLKTLNFWDIHTVYGAFWWKDLLHENITTVTSNYVLFLYTSVGDCVRDRRSGREWFSLELGAITLIYLVVGWDICFLAGHD